MPATRVTCVPARAAAQYIRAFEISDKRELFPAATTRGRVNTTVGRELTPAPDSAPVPALNEKMTRTLDGAARQHQTAGSRAVQHSLARMGDICPVSTHRGGVPGVRLTTRVPTPGVQGVVDHQTVFQ